MMQSTQGGGNEFCEEFKEESSEKEESLEEVLSRHSKEVKIIHDKEKSLKKAAAKGSKAEQKAKKKKVDEEINLLLANLKTKHQQELASLGYKKNSTQENNNINNLAMTMSGISITNPSAPPKPTRSAKRKEKRAQQEAEREQRIQEEQSNIISDRMIENEKLEQKLEPLGLTVNEIKPDGHCLYRAVEDQLSQQAGTSPYNYQELRELVAAYMREHSEDFLPFFLDDDKIATNGDTNLCEMFESYCKEVESTALWGGQLELGALTHCLKKHIVIFSGSIPEIEMGKEYKSKTGNSFDPSSIMLSYHKHAFGLGEHYNSIIPSSIR